MTDHHDFGYDDHQFDDHQYEGHDPFDAHLSPFDDAHLDVGHEDVAHEDVGHHEDPGQHADAGQHEDGADPQPTDLATSTDHPDISDMSPEDSPFPPTVDVGELPEPVDGFPWIDTGALGVVDLDPVPHAPVDPHELAAYAATDIPEGADPWSVLSGSDDPATAALARWWQDN